MNAKLMLAIRNASAEKLVEIALQFAERYPNVFEQFLLPQPNTHEIPVYRDGELPQPNTHEIPVYRDGELLQTFMLTDDEISAIRDAGFDGKICAIKKARDLTGASLMATKELVEQQGWFR